MKLELSLSCPQSKNINERRTKNELKNNVSIWGVFSQQLFPWAWPCSCELVIKKGIGLGERKIFSFIVRLAFLKLHKCATLKKKKPSFKMQILWQLPQTFWLRLKWSLEINIFFLSYSSYGFRETSCREYRVPIYPLHTQGFLYD